MVALQVDPTPLELLEMPGKLGRAEAGKLDEIADQMRLIIEPTIEGQITPFHGRRPTRYGQEALEPLHPVEQLRREPDMGLEHLDESPVAETDLFAESTHGRGA